MNYTEIKLELSDTVVIVALITFGIIVLGLIGRKIFIHYKHKKTKKNSSVENDITLEFKK